MLSVDEARDIVLKAVKKLDVETRAISDALDYYLSDSIISPSNVPPFDNSAMDGFAVVSDDTKVATAKKPVRLRIVGMVRAGESPASAVRTGECLQIMTGAPMPEGADAVVIVEDTRTEDGYALLTAPVDAGDNVRGCGEDIRESDLIMRAGTQLRPQEIGVLASLGIASVKVMRKPVVTVLTTGDELVSIGEELAPGKIRDSNRYSLRSLLVKMGCTPIELGIIRDRRKDMISAFRKAVRDSDVVMSTGGVSMGEYDLVRETISSLGKLLFWKVNMKPGKPLLFATIHGKPVFGLPGNPVSCMVSFELFARPALLKMMGSAVLLADELVAKTVSPITKLIGRSEFKRGRMWREGGDLLVDLTGPQGSGILMSVVRANCLIHLPEETGSVSEGEEVRILPL